jgi:fructan beta-fructosidase
LDRTNCSDVHIDKFSRISFAKVAPVNNRIKLHFYVDKSSIELFTNEGKEVFTLPTYSSNVQTGIEVFTLKKGTSIEYMAWPLKSIWNK